MIKYATAIRQGTATTEAILRRFTRSASHRTYQAMLEVGRAQRTIFIPRYLRSGEVQREITEGLNRVEAFNGANSVICGGKSGGAVLAEQHDELAEGRRYLGLDVLARAQAVDTATHPEEVTEPELQTLTA